MPNQRTRDRMSRFRECRPTIPARSASCGRPAQRDGMRPRHAFGRTDPPLAALAAAACAAGWYSVLLASLVPLAGCGQSAGETGDVYVDHAHEHRPAHHPRSFPAAVAGVRVRLPSIAKGRTRSAAEAAEIVGWMPELAADSDLTEPRWAPLAAGARALDRLLPRVAAGDAAALTEANAVLDRLVGLVREYGRDGFEVVPHAEHTHEHGHGHDH